MQGGRFEPALGPPGDLGNQLDWYNYIHHHFLSLIFHSISYVLINIIIISVCSELDLLEDAYDSEVQHIPTTCPDARHACSILISLLLGLLSVVSPIVYILLPVLFTEWNIPQPTCSIACEGRYITIAVKELVLIIGLWALYVRPCKSFLPRLNIYKVGMMSVTFITVACFWLFYVFRIVGNSDVGFDDVVGFSVSFIDAMLFLHYLGVLLMWLRPHTQVFSLQVTRNVDGSTKCYNMGQNSIQKCAEYVLERYYVDFTEYNPYHPRPKPRNNRMNKLSGLKLYDLDGPGDGSGDAKGGQLSAQASKAMIAAAAAGRRKEGRNDRYYEEQELERRIHKRRSRLVAAAEEAFGHIARLNAFEPTKKSAGAMAPDEASQAIFPTLARPLQKYLRTTRQQLHFPLESIMKHLSHCITFDLSARAFVQRYIKDQPCVTHVDPHVRREDWTLVCDVSPSRGVSEGTVFQLRGGSLSLVVVVGRTPVLQVEETAYNTDLDKFVLRLNSETSV